MDEELKKIFSSNLARLLEDHEKTQADLYRYMKVSSATVSDWCNGKKLPRMDKIQSIANWLHVDVSDLIKKYDSTVTETITEEEMLINMYWNLPDHRKDMLLQYAMFLQGLNHEGEDETNC